MSKDPIIIERDVEVPMRDGTVLTADVYRRAEGRWPTLVNRTPYGRSPYPDNFVLLNPVFAAENGFAVVVQDVRGRGGSGGGYRPFDESEDGYDTVQWAASQPWSTGRVGSFGSSYMAATALQAATAGPPALSAFAALQASSDYYEGRSYWGGALELGSLVSVSLAAIGSATMARLEYSDETRRIRASYKQTLEGLGSVPVSFPLAARFGGENGALRRLTPWFYDWLAHDQRDEYWDRLSLERNYPRTTAAGLHVTSWFDAMKDGALRNYLGLVNGAGSERARRDQQLVIGPWHHFGQRGYEATTVGEVSFGLAAARNIDQLQLRWFRQHLDDAGPAGGDGPGQSPVKIFVMGTNVWRDEAAWPLARAVERRLFLASDGNAASSGEDGRLGWESPSQAGVDEFDYDPRYPVPTMGGAHLLLATIAPHGPVDQRAIEQRPDVAVYTSAELSEPLEVTGDVAVELWVSTTAVSTDFTARLVDVHPDGRAISVCDGIRRLAPDASPGAADVRRVRINLGATSQAFLPGHRIRLDVSSSNFPRYDPNPNTGRRSLDAPHSVVARQRILSGPQRPSSLVLPVVAP
ncbi:CocE/NonD family hydrolase [Frankia gtarii]|uniref:CocE/NonD family hydrolase n=1 Tax=Frankia gtarii TaxID=2950102 RepID=UPI0027DF731E|nr:CocE/NonD family hydrolase [Frankia gtarii]